ncbi:MAG: zf-HC2 domain-containing protein [Chthonomonadales bacterium]|nr:zf-HC2 domain-containing protein [Chthonomonadales bacterium]
MEENRLLDDHSEQFSLCVRVRNRLPDLIEGYLDAVVAEAVRAHLAVCYSCSREFRELQQTIRLVESLPFVEAGKDFAPLVMAALDAQRRRPWWKWKPRLR